MLEYRKTPQSHIDGEKFENYAREEIFTSQHYDLIYRTPSYSTNKKDFNLSSLDPDFTFRDRQTQKSFYVECKFRRWLVDDKVEWTKTEQLYRYRQCAKKMPVFILIGVGDRPDLPELISLLPLSEAKYTGLYPSVLEKFEIEPEAVLKSKQLWSL